MTAARKNTIAGLLPEARSPLGAKADMIAHATKRAISERLDHDPAFYEKFSRLIQRAIDDYRARRLSDLEYLQRVTEIRDAVVSRKDDDLPAGLRGAAQRRTLNQIDDYLYDELKGARGIALSTAEMDEFIERVMQLA